MRLVGVCGLLVSLTAAQSSARAGGPGSAPTSQPGAATSRATTQPAFAKRPTSGPAGGFLDQKPSAPLVTMPEDTGTGRMWMMVASVLIVLVLGGVLFFVLKRLLPKLGVNVNKRVRVLETTYLGPKKAVHLLEVGSQRYLVGSSRERISMLAEVTPAFDPKDDHDAADQPDPKKPPTE